MLSASIVELRYESPDVLRPLIARIGLGAAPRHPAAAEQIREHGAGTNLDEVTIGDARCKAVDARLPEHGGADVRCQMRADIIGRCLEEHGPRDVWHIGKARSFDSRAREH